MPGWWLVLAGVQLQSAAPYRRLRPHLAALAPAKWMQAVPLVPMVRAAGDVAKMLGYPAGWAWRLRNWGRAEVHWRKLL